MKKEALKKPIVIFWLCLTAITFILFAVFLANYLSVTNYYSEKVVATVTNVEFHSEAKIGIFDVVYTSTEYTYTYSYQYNGEDYEWKTDNGNHLANRMGSMRTIYINPNNPQQAVMTTLFPCIITFLCFLLLATIFIGSYICEIERIANENNLQEYKKKLKKCFGQHE